MYRRFHDRFGTAGLIVAVVALVFAMVGGAYAAAGLNGKQKKQVKKIAKKFAGKQGKAGPVGPVGPQGLPGPKGDTGTNGTDGTDGTDGKTVLNGEGPPSDTEDGVDGDFYVDTEANEMYGPKAGGEWPAEGVPMEGSPWTAGGTLPPEETETGSWSGVIGPEIPGEGFGFVTTTLSFPIPLPTELGSGKVVTVANGETPVKSACDDGAGTAAGPKHPEAGPGFLCLFVAFGNPLGVQSLKSGGGGFGVSTAGALLQILGNPEEQVAGTFAVTAPAP